MSNDRDYLDMFQIEWECPICGDPLGCSVDGTIDLEEIYLLMYDCPNCKGIEN